MDMSFIRERRREVLTASAIFAVWGIMLLVPNNWINSLPNMIGVPISGAFSNIIGYVAMKFFGASLDHYIVGIMFMLVSLALLVYQDRGVALGFLISGSTAVYGFLALVYLLIQPIRLMDFQSTGIPFIAGVTLQTVVFGVIATELYRRVLGDEKFCFSFDRGLYLSALIMSLTGITSLSFLIFLFEAPDMNLIYPVSGTLLGLALIFSSLELLDNSVLGIWSSMILLTTFVIISIFLFGLIVPAMVFLTVEIIIWERKEMFDDIESPILWAQNNLDPWG